MPFSKFEDEKLNNGIKANLSAINQTIKNLFVSIDDEDLEFAARLAENLRSQAAGLNQMLVEANRRKGISFNPTHKLFLLGSKRPEINVAVGTAFWEKLNLIEFKPR